MRVGIRNDEEEIRDRLAGRLDFFNEDELDDIPQETPYIRQRPNDATIDTEIELESRFITPEATEEFSELTRDLRISNLSNYDVDMAMRIGEILRYIDTIERSYFKPGALNKSRRMFVSDLQYIANTRAAYKGFIPQLMRTQRMENVPTSEVTHETYEHGQAPDIGGIFSKLRRGKKPAQIV